MANQGVWLDKAGVKSANIGTGVKKVWKEIYGAWGNFDVVGAKKATGGRPTVKRPTTKAKVVKLETGQHGSGGTEGKIVKKIMMPAMPAKAQV